MLDVEVFFSMFRSPTVVVSSFDQVMLPQRTWLAKIGLQGDYFLHLMKNVYLVDQHTKVHLFMYNEICTIVHVKQFFKKVNFKQNQFLKENSVKEHRTDVYTIPSQRLIRWTLP